MDYTTDSITYGNTTNGINSLTKTYTYVHSIVMNS